MARQGIVGRRGRGSLAASAEAPPVEEVAVDYGQAAAHAAVDQAIAEIEAELAAADLDVSALDPAELLDGLDHAPPALLDSLDAGALRAALETLERSHRVTGESVVSLVASAVRDRGATNGDQLAAEAIATLRAFATRPDAPAPVVTVNVPKHDIHIDAPVNVSLPEQAPPVVNVAAAEAAPVHVNVHVPEAAPLPAPQVTVNVPEQSVLPPTLHVDVHVPEPKPRSIRVAYDDDGNKVYVPEEFETAEE